MSWGRGFGSARFDHFFQNRSERFGLLKVDAVPSSGNNAARNCALGFRAKDGGDLAIFRVKLPRQIAYGNALRSQLAKRANRFLLWGHHVGACSLEGERERFRIVGKTAHPESFLLVSRKMLLAFEQGQTRPPVHESGHPFASHARRPGEIALTQRFARGIVCRPRARALKHESGEGSGGGHPRRIANRSRGRIPLTGLGHVQATSSTTWSEGCGASERNAVELVAVPQVARSRIQVASSIARSEGCGASERSATELAVPQVARNKARRPKRHAPAHGVPNQNGRHARVARNGPAKSQKRPRLEAQVEEVRALRGVAANGAGAHSMPRKLETETLSTRTCK